MHVCKLVDFHEAELPLTNSTPVGALDGIDRLPEDLLPQLGLEGVVGDEIDRMAKVGFGVLFQACELEAADNLNSTRIPMSLSGRCSSRATEPNSERERTPNRSRSGLCAARH